MPGNGPWRFGTRFSRSTLALVRRITASRGVSGMVSPPETDSSNDCADRAVAAACSVLVLRRARLSPQQRGSASNVGSQTLVTRETSLGRIHNLSPVLTVASP